MLTSDSSDITTMSLFLRSLTFDPKRNMFVTTDPEEKIYTSWTPRAYESAVRVLLELIATHNYDRLIEKKKERLHG
jgi:hypothetical protein